MPFRRGDYPLFLDASAAQIPVWISNDSEEMCLSGGEADETACQ